MTWIRPLIASLCVLLFTSLSAQERSEEVKKEITGLSRLLRSQPPEVALRRIDSLLTLPTTGKDPVMRMGLINFRGHALRLLGRQDEALAAQVRSYDLADSLDDYKGRIDAQLAIGIIHMDLGEIDKAKRELYEVHSLTQARPTERNYRVPLVLGAVADLEDDKDSALYWYDQALPLAEAVHDSSAMCDLLFNLGLIYHEKRLDAKSETHLLRALAAMPANGYPQLEARAREALASLYVDQGRLEKVPALLDRALDLSIEHKAGDALTTVLDQRVAYFLAAGDTAAALDEAQRLIQAKDSLATVFRERTLAEVQSSFDVSRMEKELALAKAEAEVNALRAERSRIAWGAFAVIGLLAIVLAVSFYRQYKLKKQAAAGLEREKERLLQENDLLHQENLMARFETLKSQIDPHFLFNAMNTLYTLVETEPAKAREFIASFSALYRKVLTSRERTIVPMQEELELVQHYLFLQRIRFGESLQVHVEVPTRAAKGYLPPFTLQMLLENAIKHNVISAAKPLRIHVAVEGDRLVVRNDLRPRGTSEAGTGTGLENIRRRYAMLGASEPDFTLSEAHYRASVPILSQEP